MFYNSNIDLFAFMFMSLENLACHMYARKRLKNDGIVSQYEFDFILFYYIIVFFSFKILPMQGCTLF